MDNLMRLVRYELCKGLVALLARIHLLLRIQIHVRERERVSSAGNAGETVLAQPALAWQAVVQQRVGRHGHKLLVPSGRLSCGGWW